MARDSRRWRRLRVAEERRRRLRRPYRANGFRRDGVRPGERDVNLPARQIDVRGQPRAPGVVPALASRSGDSATEQRGEGPAMSEDLVRILDGNTFVVSD